MSVPVPEMCASGFNCTLTVAFDRLSPPKSNGTLAMLWAVATISTSRAETSTRSTFTVTFEPISASVWPLVISVEEIASLNATAAMNP